MSKIKNEKLDYILSYQSREGPLKSIGPSTDEVIKKYSKEKIVIKCGGKVLLDQSLLNNLIEDVVILKKLGLTPILLSLIHI